MADRVFSRQGKKKTTQFCFTTNEYRTIFKLDRSKATRSFKLTVIIGKFDVGGVKQIQNDRAAGNASDGVYQQAIGTLRLSQKINLVKWND